MFIPRKSCLAIGFGIAALCSVAVRAPIAAAEEVPCPAEDLGQTVIWDYTSYAICDNGRWTVRACAPGLRAQEDSLGNAFCG
ncbi:hypothetical protein [Nocardia sp. NPDC050406]|uniref:hypothetical protein n=1 Tax=Nocardia sp. NPDC050406 TaxID=3364318 RepID=UPI00379B6047